MKVDAIACAEALKSPELQKYIESMILCSPAKKYHSEILDPVRNQNGDLCCESHFSVDPETAKMLAWIMMKKSEMQVSGGIKEAVRYTFGRWVTFEADKAKKKAAAPGQPAQKAPQKGQQGIQIPSWL
jgi:hypothetical protein